MKTKYLFASALFLLSSLFLLQPAQGQDTEQKKEEQYATEGGSLDNLTLAVKNFSYYRKVSPDGRGELLEVFFDIANAEENTRNLAVTVVAFYEKDSTDNPMRKYIEYPKWRKVDLDKRLKNIVRFGSVPAFEKTAVNSEKKGKNEFPDFLEYTDYISKNPQSGLKVPLQGYSDAKLIEEQTKDYNMLSKSLQTSLFVRFFKGYDYFHKKDDFFNYVGVFIYDVDQEKLVYRQFFHFTKPPRVY